MPVHDDGGNVNWCSSYGTQYGHPSRNEKQHYHRQNPRNPLMGLSRKQNHYLAGIQNSQYLAGIQNKNNLCPSMDKWIKKLWYIYTT